MSADQRGASLPGADLSTAFAKPKGRAGELSLPPRRAGRKTPAPSAATSPTPEATAASAEERGSGEDSQNGPDVEQAALAVDGQADVTEVSATKTAPREAAQAGEQPARHLGDEPALAQAGVTAATRVDGPTARPRRSNRAAVRSSRAKDRPLVVSVPQRIRTRMQAARARAIANGQSYTYLDQVLDAIEKTVDDLPNLVRQHARGGRPVVQKTGLFEREVTAVVEPEALVQLTIRNVLPSQFDVIDRLVEETGAEYRSTLITAALDAALPHV